MKRITYEEVFSGHCLRYQFQHNGTDRYMAPYLRKSKGDSYDILATPEYIETHRPFYTESTEDCYIEYKSLIGLTSLAMLDHDCCIIHAVAVCMYGVCWLITAPSGTGKSTQYFNLKKLYGKEAEMICGDMPLLEKTGDGHILVHPSPWNGKERIKGMKSAPLGGILFLEQGEDNRIKKLDPSEAALPILIQLAVLPDTEKQALQVTSFADFLLCHYPVWKMINRGDLASSRLAADTFWSYLEEKAYEI